MNRVELFLKTTMKSDLYTSHIILIFCEFLQRKEDSCTQKIFFQVLGEENIAHWSNYAIHLLTLQNYFFHIASTFSLSNLNGVLSQLENLLSVCCLVFSLWTMNSLVPRIPVFLLPGLGSNSFLTLVQYNWQHWSGAPVKSAEWEERRDLGQNFYSVYV